MPPIRLALTVSALLAVSISTAAQAATAPGPSGDKLESIALDFVMMKACQMAWNYHVDEAIASGSNVSSFEMQDPVGHADDSAASTGTRYSYITNSLTNPDICGSYFIPKDKASVATDDLSAAQAQAVVASTSVFANSAIAMNDILASETTRRVAEIYPNSFPAAEAIKSATLLYKANLDAAIKPLNLMDTDPTVIDSLPITSAPETSVLPNERHTGFAATFNGANTDEAWAIRLQVANDLSVFAAYLSSTPHPAK